MSTRKLIRDDVISALTGLSTTGANVFQSRVYPIAENKLPGLCIYTSTDDAEYATLTPPRTLDRLLTITVEAYVKANTGYDNTLDQIEDEIRTALYADLTRGGNAQDTRIVAFSSQFNDEGDQPIAYGELTVEVHYTQQEG